MYQLLYFVIVLIVYSLFGDIYALPPDLCQKTPKEKHCLIEYSVRDRWPHQKRYVFNWYMKNCFEIRWSDHCSQVPKPAVTNNFPTERECLDECGGWA